jgi:hypothetical protein
MLHIHVFRYNIFVLLLYIEYKNSLYIYSVIFFNFGFKVFIEKHIYLGKKQQLLFWNFFCNDFWGYDLGDKYWKTYKVCESMSKRMVIVKLWVNEWRQGDKHRKN